MGLMLSMLKYVLISFFSTSEFTNKGHDYLPMSPLMLWSSSIISREKSETYLISVCPLKTCSIEAH